MTLFGKLTITPQRQIALLSDIEVINHVGYGVEVVRAERWAGSRDRELGTRWSLHLVFIMDRPGKKLARKAAQHSCCPLKFGCEKKYSRGLSLVQTTKISPVR